MAKSKPVRNRNSSLLGIIAWVTGVVVSLVVGFAMTDGTLGLPAWLGGAHPIGMLVVVVAGWIVIVTTLVGAILAILGK